MINPSTELWYCLACRVKLEGIVYEQLTKRMGLTAFIPRWASIVKRKGITKIAFVPMFPGYVFAKLQLVTSLVAIRYIEGVRDVVRFGDRVPSVPEGVIHELENAERVDVREMGNETFEDGSKVTVQSGVFEGFTGSVLRSNVARDRVRLLIDLLGQSAQLEIQGDGILLEH